MTREEGCYGEVVGPQGGKGTPRHIGKEMTAQKGDIWRRRLTLEENVSREILVRNSKLQTVDRLIKGLHSCCCPIVP